MSDPTPARTVGDPTFIIGCAACGVQWLAGHICAGRQIPSIEDVNDEPRRCNVDALLPRRPSRPRRIGPA